MYEDMFSERLVYLREKKGISAREMSLSIGQNESYINRIENKKAFPSMQTFFYICEYLNVTPAEFFNDQCIHPQKVAEISEILTRLSEEQLNAVLGILKLLPAT